MKKIIYAFAVVGLLAACKGSDEPTEQNDTAGTEQVAENNVTPNSVMTMEVEGMVCQMGCGASIRKELKATGGVSDCEFDFDKDRPTDVATIAYDSEVVSEQEIVDIVSKMNEKQFTVKNTSVESMEEIHPSDTAEETDNSDEATVDVSSGGFQFPNLLDLFSNLLVH